MSVASVATKASPSRILAKTIRNPWHCCSEIIWVKHLKYSEMTSREVQPQRVTTKLAWLPPQCKRHSRQINTQTNLRTEERKCSVSAMKENQALIFFCHDKLPWKVFTMKSSYEELNFPLWFLPSFIASAQELAVQISKLPRLLRFKTHIILFKEKRQPQQTHRWPQGPYSSPGVLAPWVRGLSWNLKTLKLNMRKYVSFSRFSTKEPET